MHTLDSLARAMAAPAPGPVRRRRRNPVLPRLVSISCALLPLGVMIQAYWMTA